LIGQEYIGGNLDIFITSGGVLDMRDFKTPFGAKFLETYQKGVLSYQYKNIPCLKSPLDIAIYLRLLWLEKPKTIIEIGTKNGGSALLFSDFSRMMSLDCHIVTIDLNIPPSLDDRNIHFIQGNIFNLEVIFANNQLDSLPRPWFVVEDSAHTYTACIHALSFFSSILHPGEILAMEDGNLSELGLSEKYGGGPSRAIEEFFLENPNCYTIETMYCDMFGINATYNPNGYLRKT
jgi:cephalosporin hydroxylase